MSKRSTVLRALLLVFAVLSCWPAKVLAHGPAVTRDCSAYSYAPPFPAAPDTYRARYHTIAHTFLDMEQGVGPVTASEYAILDAIIDKAKARLRPIPKGLSEAAQRQFAVDSLRTIDCILVSHGFVYPGTGRVHLLSDGLDLTIFTDAADYQTLLGNRHNAGRKSFIEQRKPGPYYVVDCDTASYIYLAIAEVLNYPLAMVQMPEHNFLRWLLPGGSYIDFETMDGIQTEDDYYRANWGIPERFLGTPGVLSTMSKSQLLAYHHFALGISYTWKSDLARAIAEYKKSISVDGTLGDAANNLAWLYSVAPDQCFRDGQKAVLYAQQAVDIFPSGDRLDTLACAFGAAGRFAEGVAAEERAIQAGWVPHGSNLSGNLALLKRGHTCEDPTFGIDRHPFRPTHPMPREAALQKEANPEH